MTDPDGRTDPVATIDVPYLIVGAGPVGLMAARLLGNAGAGCLVVERRDGPQRHPAAHVVNARSLEIFRQAGLDMAAIDRLAKDPADAGHVNFVTRLSGELIGRLPFERQGPEVYELTPHPLRNISQHRLEPILADTVAAMPTVDLRYRSEWRSSEQGADGVTSLVRDLATGAEIEVRSSYLLAADGAGSRVRKSLGIEMIGPSSLQSYIAIHVEADLRPVVADRPGVLHFVMDPAANGVFIAHDPEREWVFMVSFDPETESAEDYDAERSLAIVRRAIGGNAGATTDLEFVSAGSWHMSAQVAERMRHERIFLVGDAAHRFPPTGGLGLNSGVADVHNLAWKLLAVEAGWAGADLLATYEAERRPVAVTNCEQSTANAFKLVTLLDALGIVDDPTTEALRAALDDPARRAAIDAGVADQATHFDMIGLQLGYSYADAEAVEHPSVFEPDGSVGTRLPHAWLADGRSTLDLVDADRPTLLSFGESAHWSCVAAGVAAPVVHTAVGGTGVPDSWSAACGLETGGALLVRPDQHVMWRSPTDAGDVSADAASVAFAVTQLLGR